ncbi:hypothetical protein HNY73_009248 [Argiope bruennichi]|uniref:Uncharacterized protein n=1 Tax=Argiope bruennichi TaxID=94029 RepID=A0A8T0FFI8_ARGBR|nr:hypothetical protein HNY73_009248 [Argiope bruennichi]
MIQNDNSKFQMTRAKNPQLNPTNSNSLSPLERTEKVANSDAIIIDKELKSDKTREAELTVTASLRHFSPSSLLREKDREASNNAIPHPPPPLFSHWSAAHYPLLRVGWDLREDAKARGLGGPFARCTRFVILGRPLFGKGGALEWVPPRGADRKFPKNDANHCLTKFGASSCIKGLIFGINRKYWVQVEKLVRGKVKVRTFTEWRSQWRSHDEIRNIDIFPVLNG